MVVTLALKRVLCSAKPPRGFSRGVQAHRVRVVSTYTIVSSVRYIHHSHIAMLILTNKRWPGNFMIYRREGRREEQLLPPSRSLPPHNSGREWTSV